MDVDAVLAGDLDTWSLPVVHPFTTATARASGVTHRHLRVLVEGGFLRRPVRGVYVGSSARDTPTLRAACLRLVVPPHCVVVDRHAGWLLGAEMILAPGEHLDLRPLSLFVPAGRTRLRNTLSTSGERALSRRDVVEIDGVRVTTALRTTCDLGRVRFPEEAMTGMSSMLRLGATTREQVLAEVERFRGQRWVTTLRTVAPLADGRHESPPEAVLAMRCRDVGLVVEPQVEVRDDDGLLLGRLDLGNRELKVGVEYDGSEWHHSPEQLAADRARRRLMVEAGWLIVVFRKEDLFSRIIRTDGRLMLLRREAERRRPQAG